MDPAEPIDIALRVYAQPKRKARPRTAWQEQDAGPWRPHGVLFLDCETTNDHTQRLNFGFYRYCRILWAGAVPTLNCVEEGIFCADDLPERDPEGFAVLRRFVATHRADVRSDAVRSELRLRSQDDFLYHVLYLAAYRGRALVCGFNLPFDLSRLARHAGEARASRRRGEGDDAASATYRGGFSFSYWGHVREGAWHDRPSMPRVAIKSLDSKRALIGFVPPKGAARAERSFRGHFLDLRTLAFALTGESHSLESACATFGVEHGKAEVSEHGRIIRQYIRYARRDVLATSELFTATISEYLEHPIALPPTRAFSPASIGKAYLEAMGIAPILARQADFPKQVLGIAMHAYVGGRAECRVRRQLVPVRYCDFRSMYPTVCALMGVWDLLTAQRIEVVDDTAEIRSMLGNASLDAAFDPATWKRLVGFVEIEPEGDILPVRARYDPAGQSWQIGLNPVTSRRSLWVTIADALDAALLGGRPPKVRRAIRLLPKGRLPTLRPVLLGGRVRIDPQRADFFRAVIEERVRLLRSSELGEVERARLERFLKTLANATSYGIFAELSRRELPARARAWVRVYGPDGHFDALTPAPEDAGPYFFPPIAAAITGAARLMLGLVERTVTDAGGTHAFADTDSMAIVASRGGDKGARIPELGWVRVEAIRRRFRRLSPYDPALVGDLLKLEDENVDHCGKQRELECLAISAKRYALLVRGRRGAIELVKHSEHGLGHLLNPLDPDDERRDWMREVWLWIVRRELGYLATPPTWFRQPAVGQVTVSSSTLLRPFAQLNRGRSYEESVKPFNFILTAHVLPFGHPNCVAPERFQLVAPYEKDPGKWLGLPWIDRYSGRSYAITTSGQVGGVGTARVKRYGEVVAEYRAHGEGKSLGPDGSRCGPETRGLLLRRPVLVREVRYIGKESNNLDRATSGLYHEEGEVLSRYEDAERDPWLTLIVPIIRDIPTEEMARKTRLDRSTIKRYKSGRALPHARNRTKLVRTVGTYARRSVGRTATRLDDFAACRAYLDRL